MTDMIDTYIDKMINRKERERERESKYLTL